MKTIALRFSDKIAPKDGTIVEHERIIKQLGFVWYGKFGSKVSEKIKSEILSNEDKRVLLIHSGTSKQYWLYIEDISDKMPDIQAVPEYYRDIAGIVKSWFKVVKIQKADKDIMKKCTVSSSGLSLSIVSRHSMSPYFIIDFDEGV